MTIRFYSSWIDIFEHGKDWQDPHNNSATQDLADELKTVLGNRKLVSMTSAATNGIVVTTIAYEETDEQQ